MLPKCCRYVVGINEHASVQAINTISLRLGYAWPELLVVINVQMQIDRARTEHSLSTIFLLSRMLTCSLARRVTGGSLTLGSLLQAEYLSIMCFGAAA